MSNYLSAAVLGADKERPILPFWLISAEFKAKEYEITNIISNFS